jgi:hypothetical protein
LHEDGYQGRKAWGDQLDFHSEVNHISINGNIGLAVTQFNYQLTTSEGGRNNGGHLSLWVAEKRGGSMEMEKRSDGRWFQRNHPTTSKPK